MIGIEKGVPMPGNVGSVFSRNKYPWENMEVGDSFFVPGKSSFTAAIRAASKRTGFVFVFRREDDGTRIWRVAGSVPKSSPAAVAPAAPAPTAPVLPRRRLTANPAAAGVAR